MLVRHRYPTPADRSFDRAFEQITSSFFDSQRQAGPRVAGTWGDAEYVLTIDLPGVPADAVDIEVTGNTLVLGAHTDSMEWQRSLKLSGRLDAEKVSASHVDGRLTVRIGTFDEPEARRIEVDTTAAPAAIEAEASSDEDQSTETNSTD